MAKFFFIRIAFNFVDKVCDSSESMHLNIYFYLQYDSLYKSSEIYIFNQSQLNVQREKCLKLKEIYPLAASELCITRIAENPNYPRDFSSLL